MLALSLGLALTLGASVDGNTFGVLVASSAGGPGQHPLAFTHHDVARVKELLVQVGRVRAENLEVVTDPTRAQLVGALRAAVGRVQVAQASGQHATLVFYYSGHARAQALTLGPDELALADLRDELGPVGDALVIVILDACQSGSFSGIKGVDAAAQFSTNTANMLETAGLAVLASSSGNELSQESPTLKGSFFTHHLLVGLRGAADLDADGRVTLSEAYHYAYGRTLLSTSATAVGGQHPTFETNLKGKGEVPLSFPRDATATLSLPAALAGEVVVALHSSIIAELHKAAGAPLQLGLAAGTYEVSVRQDHQARTCTVELREQSAAELRVDACPVAAVSAGSTKGAPTATSPWGVEFSAGADVKALSPASVFSPTIYSAYDLKEVLPLRLRLSVSYDVNSIFTVALDARMLDVVSLANSSTGASLTAVTMGVGPVARANTRFWDDRLVVYGQLGAGLAFAPITTTWSSARSNSLAVGYLVGAGLGAQLALTPHLGLFLQANYDSAPVLKNFTARSGEAADPYQSGGFSGAFGLRVRF